MAILNKALSVQNMPVIKAILYTNTKFKSGLAPRFSQ